MFVFSTVNSWSSALGRAIKFPCVVFVCVYVCVAVGWGDSMHANVPPRQNTIRSFVFPHLYVWHLTLPKAHLNTVLHLALTCECSRFPPSLSLTQTCFLSLYFLSLSLPLSYFLWYNRGRGGDASPRGCQLGSCCLSPHLCTTDLFFLFLSAVNQKPQMESEA